MVFYSKRVILYSLVVYFKFSKVAFMHFAMKRNFLVIIMDGFDTSQIRKHIFNMLKCTSVYSAYEVMNITCLCL